MHDIIYSEIQPKMRARQCMHALAQEVGEKKKQIQKESS